MIVGGFDGSRGRAGSALPSVGRFSSSAGSVRTGLGGSVGATGFGPTPIDLDGRPGTGGGGFLRVLGDAPSSFAGVVGGVGTPRSRGGRRGGRGGFVAIVDAARTFVDERPSLPATIDHAIVREVLCDPRR